MSDSKEFSFDKFILILVFNFVRILLIFDVIVFTGFLTVFFTLLMFGTYVLRSIILNYKDGVVSFGKAVELSNMNYQEFIVYCNDRGFGLELQL